MRELWSHLLCAQSHQDVVFIRSSQHPRTEATSIPFLQMRTLRLREGEGPTYGHTAGSGRAEKRARVCVFARSRRKPVPTAPPQRPEQHQLRKAGWAQEETSFRGVLDTHALQDWKSLRASRNPVSAEPGARGPPSLQRVHPKGRHLLPTARTACPGQGRSLPPCTSLCHPRACFKTPSHPQ